MEGTGEAIEKWEVDEMMNDGDKNQDGMLDYEGKMLLAEVKFRNCFSRRKSCIRPNNLPILVMT